MFREWLAAEFHRLRVVEEGPESPRKDATLRAVRSNISRLLGDRRATPIGTTLRFRPAEGRELPANSGTICPNIASYSRGARTSANVAALRGPMILVERFTAVQIRPRSPPGDHRRLRC